MTIQVLKVLVVLESGSIESQSVELHLDVQRQKLSSTEIEAVVQWFETIWSIQDMHVLYMKNMFPSINTTFITLNKYQYVKECSCNDGECDCGLIAEWLVLTGLLSRD